MSWWQCWIGIIWQFVLVFSREIACGIFSVIERLLSWRHSFQKHGQKRGSHKSKRYDHEWAIQSSLRWLDSGFVLVVLVLIREIIYVTIFISMKCIWSFRVIFMFLTYDPFGVEFCDVHVDFSLFVQMERWFRQAQHRFHLWNLGAMMGLSGNLRDNVSVQIKIHMNTFWLVC